MSACGARCTKTWMVHRPAGLNSMATEVSSVLYCCPHSLVGALFPLLMPKNIVFH